MSLITEIFENGLGSDALDALSQTAQSRWEWGDFTGAAASYQALLKRGKKRLDKKVVGAAESNLAYCFQQLAQHSKAVVSFEQALRLNPSIGHAWRAACFSYGELKQFADMLRCAQKATKVAPQDDYAWQQLGLAHAGLKDFRRAIDADLKALKLNPANAYARLNLAMALFSNQSEGYLAHARQAVQEAGELRESIDADRSFREALVKDPAMAKLLSAKRKAAAPVEEPTLDKLGDWLVNACVYGDLDSAKRALKAGARVDGQRENPGRTAIIAAIAAGNRKLVELLLDLGADINARDDEGETGLIRWVSEQNGLKFTEFLLDRGADINAQNVDGWTALVHAAHWDDRWNAMVSLLLDRGADVNHATKDGWTALIIASHSRIVARGPFKILVKAKKLKVDQRGAQYGWTALLVAARKSCPDIVSLLLEAGANPNLTLQLSSAKPYRPVATLAGNLFGELKVPFDRRNFNALAWAQRSRDRAKVPKMLIEAGAKEL